MIEHGQKIINRRLTYVTKYLEETFQPQMKERAEENIKQIRKTDVREVPLVTVKELNSLIKNYLSGKNTRI